jgi:hypothetical protein
MQIEMIMPLAGRDVFMAALSPRERSPSSAEIARNSGADESLQSFRPSSLRRLRFVSIAPHPAALAIERQGGNTMNIRKESRNRADMLSSYYRAIGPGAIMAALLCMPKTRKNRYFYR